MGAAVTLRDVVGEGQHGLVERVVPPQRDLDADVVALGPHEDRLRHALDRFARAVEIAHEGLDPALVEQLLALVLGMARVGEDDAHAGIEEGEFAQALLQRRVVELDHRERVGGGQERHFRAAPSVAVAHDHQRRHRVAVAELHRVLLAVTPDAQAEPLREGVDDGDADAVKAAGDLVGILVELTARMKLGHDDLGGRDPLLLVDVGGDAAAVIGHRHRAVGVEGTGDDVGMARQRLVDGVVHHLVDHVMQARPVIGVADIHAGPLAHGIQPLEHADGFRSIGRSRQVAGGVVVGHVGHQVPQAGGSLLDFRAPARSPGTPAIRSVGYI